MTTHIILLTFSMKQSLSGQCNRFSDSQEIPHILWNPKFRHRIHKCQPPVPILDQIYPVHALTLHFLKIHLNTILPSTPGSSKWYFSLGVSHHNPVYSSTRLRLCYMPCPSYYSQFDYPKKIGKEYRSSRSSFCSFLQSSLTSPLLDPHILVSTLFSNILSVRSSLSVRDQDSHSYKTTGKIIVLYILIFVLWLANWKTKDLFRMIASIS